MNIIVCGAGEVGSHAAEILHAARHSVTVIDTDAAKLRAIEESMDVAALLGNCVEGEVLQRAGADSADMVVAATSHDEVNLLSASIGKGLGARKAVARVHDVSFFEERGFQYREHLGVDRLICPEYSTALAIARKLRTPAAVAIENFARGRIEMHEFTATASGSAIGKRLMDVSMPSGTRLALIRRKGEAYIPEATTVVVAGDSIILVGNADAFQSARKLFAHDKAERQNIVLMGGGSMSVWLCRAMNERRFALRLFEKSRERAVELAEELPWVTVIQGDPTERAMFDEERLAQADVFLSLLDSDEENIIAGVLAKTRGVEQVIAILQRSKYLDLVFDIGVDHAFSTRRTAGDEIEHILDERPLRLLGTLANGSVDVFRVLIQKKSAAIGKPLRDIPLSPDWVVAAIQRANEANVPSADDVIEEGDVVLVVGKHGKEGTLKSIF